jgi:serine/threonine-protein kinase
VGAAVPLPERQKISSSTEAPKLGRYVIQSELGRGAMGIVYKATDSVLERTVAVKTVNMSLEQEGADKYEARFYQEARAAAGLNHPNIVTVHDVGKSGDVMFMAMEYIEGVELRSLMGEGQRVGIGQAVSIAAQIAEGLAYAHQRGVVHRDIKPANIMVLPNGPAKITDFGIARRRAASELTQTGMLLGSPKYMSPEQVIGKRADHRSDIFSLGVILYEMLCGAAPFSGENVTALMYQTVNFVPPPPSSVNPSVPELLDFIAAKMLAKPVEERYQEAQDVARDLRECERQLGTATPGTQPSRTLMGTTPAPQIASVDTRTVVLGQTLNRTRDADKAPSEPAAEEAPARIAPSFDSLEATQRLAAMTGAATTWAPQSATQAVSALPRPAGGWRRRDWILVGGAAALGLVLAGLVARRRD